MKFQLDWLRDYISGDVPEPHVLRERLTSAGFIVEGVEQLGSDVIFDVELTANRPDAMNHRGLAREVALSLGREFNDSRFRVPPVETGPSVTDLATVTIEEPGLCSRYSARVIEGIRPGEASPFVASRLQAIGSNQISGPVDATNFVLWDIGQPLHAFDLDRLAPGADGKPAIVVRRARDGEKLVTLDGVERVLNSGHLVIADAEKPVALAGVMGGLDTAISPESKRILLESAHFHAPAVRMTAKSLGMHTDASHRFERGTDPTATVDGLNRAALLILESNGGVLASGVIDAVARQIPPRAIRLRLKRVPGFLGMDVGRDTMLGIFAALGFTWTEEAGEVLSITVPPARIDLELEADLIEEVIRHVGYGSLPETLPPAFNPAESLPILGREEAARDLLAGMGLKETQTYSFVSRAENEPFQSLAPGEPPEIENPLGEPFSIMRSTPLIGLLKSAQQNVRRGILDLAFFEVNRAFGMQDGKPRERRCATFLLCGVLGHHFSGESRRYDFYDGSGVIASLLAGLGAPLPRFEARQYPFLAPGRSATAVSGGSAIGWVGALEHGLAASWDLSDPIAGEIDLTALEIPPHPASLEAPPRFPGSDVDLTVTHKKSVSWQVLEDAAVREAPKELSALSVRGQFAGTGVPFGFIKTTLTLSFVSPVRSLSREEINGWRDAAARRLLALGETRVDGFSE